MEWNQLRTFLTAAREENFSRAAAILHTSQPSLSQTIKRLEEELGYPLFDREGKHIRLNESGKVWMQTVSQMEEMYENTKLRLEEAHGKPHPQVSIHIGCASTVLPGLLQFLRERDPRIQYEIHQWNVVGENREKDIRILAELPESTRYPESAGETESAGKPESAGHLESAGKPEAEGRLESAGHTIVLLEEPIMLAVPAGHSLLRLQEITLTDLEKEEFINLNSNWALTREIAQEMKRLRFTPKVTMWVDNPNLMRELLKAHMGIAFVPALSWKSFAGEEVVIRPVKGCAMKRYVYLQTPERAYMTREQKECVKGIREYFQRLS